MQPFYNSEGERGQERYKEALLDPGALGSCGYIRPIKNKKRGREERERKGKKKKKKIRERGKRKRKKRESYFFLFTLFSFGVDYFCILLVRSRIRK